MTHKTAKSLTVLPRGINSTTSIESLIPKSIRVLGITPASGEKKREVILEINSNGIAKNYHFPLSELACGERKLLATIFAETGHFDLAEGPPLKRVAAAILEEARTHTAIILTTQGWHKVVINDETYGCYVWGDKADWFGLEPQANVVVSNSQNHVPASCSLKHWKLNVGKKLAGNPYLIVTHAHTLASAIRRIFGQPLTSISLVGQSSIGKSTVQQSAQSIVGPIDGVTSMSGTKIGLLEYLLARPDSPVFFQDTRQNDRPAILFDLVFDVADGAGRMRSGDKVQPKNGATMILSNERLAIDMQSKNKVPLDEGLFARLFEIVCHGPYGAFHNLHGCESGAEFAKELKNNSEKYHGAVWPAWIQALSENWERVHQLHSKWLPMIKTKIDGQVGDLDLHQVNNRVLDSIMFSAWVGVIASELGILPVSKKEIVSAYALVVKEHISRQISGTTPLGDEVVNKVRGCLDENIAHFPKLAAFNDESHRAGILGYRSKTKQGEEIFMFLPHIFDREFKEKFGSVAYEILSNAGFLVTSSGRGNQYLARIPGTELRKSFVAIRASIRFL